MAIVHRLPRKRAAKHSDAILRPGTAFCRCASCGEYFLSSRAFDAHRVGGFRIPGDRHCIEPAWMAERGLRLNARGIWRLVARRIRLAAAAA